MHLSLVNDASQLNVGNVNDFVEKIFKEAVMTCFKVLAWQVLTVKERRKSLARKIFLLLTFVAYRNILNILMNTTTSVVILKVK